MNMVRDVGDVGRLTIRRPRDLRERANLSPCFITSLLLFWGKEMIEMPLFVLSPRQYRRRRKTILSGKICFKSDTPREAGGLMNVAASKAVEINHSYWYI
jgi:hypothetical protein